MSFGSSFPQGICVCLCHSAAHGEPASFSFRSAAEEPASFVLPQHREEPASFVIPQRSGGICMSFGLSFPQGICVCLFHSAAQQSP
jgi:hypothetical protein